LGIFKSIVNHEDAAIMGRAPNAIAHLFCASASDLKLLEKRCAAFLVNQCTVDLPFSWFDNETATWLVRKNDLVASPIVKAASSVLLNVRIDSPANALSFGRIRVNANSDSSEANSFAKQIVLELLTAGLCDGIFLPYGIERKLPILGAWTDEAIIASPDFAILTALWLEGHITKDNEGRIAQCVVPLLDKKAPRQTYCRAEWMKMIAETKRDARFNACW
jgi:predicted outer membrane lipoprotein